MPAHVPDARLRGRIRAEKQHGHATGGQWWRTYDREQARKDSRLVQAGSWWVGLSDEAFTAEARSRHRKMMAEKRDTL